MCYWIGLHYISIFTAAGSGPVSSAVPRHWWSQTDHKSFTPHPIQAQRIEERKALPVKDYLFFYRRKNIHLNWTGCSILFQYYRNNKNNSVVLSESRTGILEHPVVLKHLVVQRAGIIRKYHHTFVYHTSNILKRVDLEVKLLQNHIHLCLQHFI